MDCWKQTRWEQNKKSTINVLLGQSAIELKWRKILEDPTQRAAHIELTEFYNAQPVE